MSPERWRQVEKVLQEALAAPPGELAALLERACGDDADLRRRVEALIEADAEAGGFLEVSGVVQRTTLVEARPEPRMIGRTIGPYELRRKIGEGGMSSVYLAVRADDEYRKKVAVKFVRHGFDRQDLLRRFRTERQILAGLEHPHIARFLDGGTTEEGLPYFVMEHIEGEPIDTYCDARRLTVGERLELFRSVCSAVHYAHQNLIVHRDLKPGNILVTADGTPKLLDFGIAKLVNPEHFPQTVEYTATGTRLMTPYYASPEQVLARPISTASDVYSLGVLLYKLLTGHLPYASAERLPHEAGRAAVEEEPERPSSAIARMVAGPDGEADTPITPESVARARRTRPGELRRLLADDLDNVVLKALRKEPQRRYASAEQLAEDLRRYRRGLPVTARKDTLRYRASRFLRRNRLGVAAAMAFVAVIVGFAVTMAVQAARLADQRDLAERQRDTAEEVTGFLESIFLVSDPEEGRGGDVTAREILERGAARIAELEGKPRVQVRLMDAIGRVYINLGLYASAGPILEEALAIRRDVSAERDAGLGESLNNLGVLRLIEGDFDRAETLLREALAVSLAVLGEDHELVAESKNNLATVLKEQGDFAAAVELYGGSLRILRHLHGDGHPRVATLLNNQAVMLSQLGDHAAAEPLFREALALRRRVLGERHPFVGSSLVGLGGTLTARGDAAAAEPLLRQGLEILGETFDAGHWRVADGKSLLAACLVAQERFAEAELLATSAYATLAASRGGLKARAALGRVVALYEAWGRPEQAAEYRALLED